MSTSESRRLLVEDDERIRIELLDALRAAGYEPEVAVDLRGARVLAERPCDLVLLDLGPPDGDGLIPDSGVKTAPGGEGLESGVATGRIAYPAISTG